MAESTPQPSREVFLRDVIEDDLPVFFQNQLDPEAGHMAAFTAKDPSDLDAFMAHWNKILADDAITKRTIVYVDGAGPGRVAGNIGCFEYNGNLEVGYWVGKEYWGKRIATRVLSEFLNIVKTRPLYAAAASDNAASIRVLEKCGFAVTGHAKSFANARGEEIEEVILELR